MRRLAGIGEIPAKKTRNGVTNVTRNVALPFPHRFPTVSPPFRDGPIRVAILGPVLYVGGAERWMATLLRYADPERIRWVGVGATHGQGGTAPEMVREIRGMGVWIAMGGGACAHLARSADVVISWGLPDVAAYLGPRGTDRPIHIATSHGDGDSDWTRQVMAGACPEADAVVAVSPAAVAPIPEPWRSHAVIIDNGIDRVRLARPVSRAATRAAWGAPDGLKLIGYVGRLAFDKDPMALARTLEELPAGWAGVLCGDGIHAQDVLRETERRARGRVRHVPATLNVGSVYHAIDWQLCSGPTEGFGLSMVESWTVGLPVVGTPVGAAVAHPECLRVVPRFAPGRDLAASFLADAADPDGTRSRTAHARRVARERFGPACFGSRWTELITSMARSTLVPASP